MRKLLNQYIEMLLETANEEFLDEFIPIYDEYMSLQDEYGPINVPVWYDPDGEAHYNETQKVPEEDQPEYVKDAPEYYKNQSNHPSTRRASFSQTNKEVKIEKKLLRLFQKYADQNFFDSITIYHDLNYRAALQQPWTKDLKFSEFKRTDYFDLEGQKNKDVMSCHGSTDGSIRGDYGMILKGHVIFASRGDLGSQTLRTAHKKVKEKHKSSGLPKRTGPEKVHPSKKEVERQIRINKMRRKLASRRGQEGPEELNPENASKRLNDVIIEAGDVKGKHIEEILIDNWEIVGWYCRISDGTPFPEKFWKQAFEQGISKPVFAVNPTGKAKEIKLDRFFGINESKKTKKISESREFRLDSPDFYYKEDADEVINFILQNLESIDTSVPQTFEQYFNWQYPLSPEIWASHWEEFGFAFYTVQVSITPLEFDDDHPGWNIDANAGFGPDDDALVKIDIQIDPRITIDLKKIKRELYNAIPHELHHLTQENEPFERPDCPGLPPSKEENYYDYFTKSCEVPSFLIGFRGESAVSSEPIEDLVTGYLTNYVNTGAINQEELKDIRNRWVGHRRWKKSETQLESKDLRKYIKQLLVEEKLDEPDMSQYVDDLENEIFALLFQKSTFDYLQSQSEGNESTIVLDTSLFDEYNNINEVHLGFLVNDSGAADVQAAYICVPEERNKSNLVLSLNIPREYPYIDGFQDWLSAELADSLSHEIQHSCDTSEMLGGDIPEGEEKWASLENIEKYYNSEAEVRGHIAGILGRARRTGQNPENLLNFDIETIMMQALDRGFQQKEIEPVLQNIYNKWSTRLENKL